MASLDKVGHAELAQRVLEYFRRNTRAMDSADGVARFWVGEHVGAVERCLVGLHEQGLLDRHTIGGSDFYSLREVSAQVAEQRLDPEDGHLSALTSLIRTIEDLRPGTRERSMRVAETAALIAAALRLPAPRIQLLKRAAALHGAWRLLGSSTNGSGREHETDGGRAFLVTERMLAPIAALHDVREIILRASDWCEAGRGLLEVGDEDIPLESRILAVSEEFVRGTADGADSRTTRGVIKRIRARSDCRHDSVVVNALCRLVKEGAVR